MANRVRNQCFTFNNYTEEEVELLVAFGEEKCKYLVMGREEASTGTKHLQCAAIFKNQIRLSTLQAVTTGHIHMAGVIRAMSGPNNAFDYCMKGEQPHDEWTKFGINGPNFGENADFEEVGDRPEQGKRTDFDEARTIIQSHPNWRDVLNDPSITETVARYTNWAQQVWYARAHTPMTWLEVTDGRADSPNEFQSKILAIIAERPNDRTINWVYDPLGGAGKSKLTMWLLCNKQAFYASGKAADIFYAYQKETLIILDLPRSTDGDWINYGAIEKLKDGIVFSPKFASGLKLRAGENAHIFIFSNSLPDMKKWTHDRYNIIKVSEEPAPIIMPQFEPDTSNFAQFMAACE